MKELGEILKYKWLESEKIGYDISMERGIREWFRKYFTFWGSAQPD